MRACRKALKCEESGGDDAPTVGTAEQMAASMTGIEVPSSGANGECPTTSSNLGLGFWV